MTEHNNETVTETQGKYQYIKALMHHAGGHWEVVRLIKLATKEDKHTCTFAHRWHLNAVGDEYSML